MTKSSITPKMSDTSSMKRVKWAEKEKIEINITDVPGCVVLKKKVQAAMSRLLQKK